MLPGLGELLCSPHIAPQKLTSQQSSWFPHGLAPLIPTAPITTQSQQLLLPTTSSDSFVVRISNEMPPCEKLLLAFYSVDFLQVLPSAQQFFCHSVTHSYAPPNKVWITFLAGGNSYLGVLYQLSE